MFIASTVNAKSVSASDLPVVVLTYRNQSYLVKATEKYEARTTPIIFPLSLLGEQYAYRELFRT